MAELGVFACVRLCVRAFVSTVCACVCLCMCLCLYIMLSVGQAMDLKVPVVARDIPGNAAVVRHDVTGLLYSTPQV